MLYGFRTWETKAEEFHSLFEDVLEYARSSNSFLEEQLVEIENGKNQFAAIAPPAASARLLSDLTVLQATLRDMRPGEERYKILQKCYTGVQKRKHLADNMSENIRELLEIRLNLKKNDGHVNNDATLQDQVAADATEPAKEERILSQSEVEHVQTADD